MLGLPSFSCLCASAWIASALTCRSLCILIRSRVKHFDIAASNRSHLPKNWPILCWNGKNKFNESEIYWVMCLCNSMCRYQLFRDNRIMPWWVCYIRRCADEAINRNASRAFNQLNESKKLPKTKCRIESSIAAHPLVAPFYLSLWHFRLNVKQVRTERKLCTSDLWCRRLQLNQIECCFRNWTENDTSSNLCVSCHLQTK